MTSSFVQSMVFRVCEVLRFMWEDICDDESFADLIASLGWEAPQRVQLVEIRNSVPMFLPVGALVELSESAFRPERDILLTMPALLAQLGRVFSIASTPSDSWNAFLEFPFNTAEFGEEFQARLIDKYIVCELSYDGPALLAFLTLTGIVSQRWTVSGGQSGRVDYMRTVIVWDRLAVLHNPPELLLSSFGWGGNAFDFDQAMGALTSSLCLLRQSFTLNRPSDDRLDRYYETFSSFRGSVEELQWAIVRGVTSGGSSFSLNAVVMPIPPQENRRSRPSGIAVRLGMEGTVSVFDSGAMTLEVDGGQTLADGLSIEIYADDLAISPVGSMAHLLDIAVTFTATFPRLAPASGTSTSEGIKVERFAAALRISGSVETPAVALEFRLESAEAFIDTEKSDSFLRVIAPNGVRVPLAATVGLSSVLGLYVDGRAGLRIDRSTAYTYGPLQICRLSAALDGAGGISSLAFCVTLKIALGPVLTSVHDIGFRLVVDTSEDTVDRRNFGGAQVSFGFRPPTGLALAIDSAAVVGGGFIRFDSLSGRYIGAFSLNILKLNLNALAVIDTRATGVSGYSFLIAISSQFSPLQLGMGFTLMGVGGLCGIQRSVSLDALQSGVRDGSLAPLLFARDPVGQASQLVTGLQRVFPPTPDRYVFGPMFKLGWGTPTLVTADLGIILQLPAPIVIALIGTLRATFPKPQAAVVVLNIDIAGSVDPAEKRLAIDARIRDSRIAGYTLSGDMALRLRWGDRPDFALALGGFHSAYQPPEGFPELRRLSLGLSRGNTFRMTCAAYLALTSNSLQLGARAEIFVQTMGFNVLGYLEFNALVMFSPFSFRFDFAAGLALRRNTTVLASITVSGLVSGPQPWRVQGSASISILFFELSVSFDVEFGQPQVTAPAQPAGLWDRLRTRVQDPRSWTALLPPETHRVVSLSSAGGTEAPLRLDPMGGLRFTQTEVPLGRRITRFGEMSVDAPTTFRVQTVQIQERNALVTPVQESFAPGQYQHLTEAEKLSRPSFEPMDAGMSLCADALQVRGVVGCAVSYQTLVVSGDDETLPSSAGPYDPSAAVVAASLDFSGAQLAPLYTTGDDRFLAPGTRPLVVLDDEPYLVVHAASLRPLTDNERAAFPGAATTTAPGAAHDALAAFLCTHPEAQGHYRVVPRYEAVRDEP